MKYGIGEWVVAERRVGIVHHFDGTMPLPYSVAFVDTGEVLAFSSKELRGVREVLLNELL